MSHEPVEALRPHDGPAREPKRMNIPLTPSATYDSMSQQMVESPLEMPAEFPGLPDFPDQTLLSGPPPDEPEQASSVAALERDKRELLEALEGQRTRLTELELQMALNAQVQTAQSRPKPVYAPVQLPPGVRPDQNVTVEQLTAFLQQALPALQEEAEAAAIRAQWSVTPEQEQDIRAKFPQLQASSSLEQTKFIRDAAKKLYPAKSGNHQSQVPANTRIPRNVPLEAAHPVQGIHEPEADNALKAALKEYSEAQKIGNVQRRMAAMKLAANKISTLQGLGPLRLPVGVTEG